MNMTTTKTHKSLAPPSPPTTPPLSLSHPTPEESKRIWSATAGPWGTAITEEQYIERETLLTHLPLAHHGAARQWMLTTPETPGVRPILSSCDTLRRRGLVAVDGTVTEVEVQAIGAVYTEECFRGRGYARRLMEMVKAEFAAPRSISGHSTPGFSVLYSDIGKSYYSSMGWNPHASRHITLSPSCTGTGGVRPVATPLRMHSLAPLCAHDEQNLVKTLSTAKRPTIALIPDYDTILWHLLREDFMTTALFPHPPTTRGAIIGPAGQRIWAVWVRSYYSGPTDPSENTLHILRLAFEEHGDLAPSKTDPKTLVQGVRAVLDVAVKEAAEWVTSAVHLWNVDPALLGALRDDGLVFEEVERETSSIPSVMMLGEFEKLQPEVWMANEKFGWY